MTARRSFLVISATMAGLVGGWFLAQQYLARHRAALFSPNARRRHAALGFLAGRPSAETMRLLRDYLAWERHPRLIRRGRRLLRELELSLA